MLIDALDVWLQIPEGSLNIIKKVVDLLHTSSLMLVHVSILANQTNGKIGLMTLRTILLSVEASLRPTRSLA